MREDSWRGLGTVNTPSLFSVQQGRCSAWAGATKVTQNALCSAALGLPWSAGCRHCPTTQCQESPCSLGPATDACLISCLNPGSSCLVAAPQLGSWILLQRPRKLCFAWGKACRCLKGSLGALSGPRAFSVRHEIRNKGVTVEGSRGAGGQLFSVYGSIGAEMPLWGSQGSASCLGSKGNKQRG